MTTINPDTGLPDPIEPNQFWRVAGPQRHYPDNSWDIDQFRVLGTPQYKHLRDVYSLKLMEKFLVPAQDPIYEEIKKLNFWGSKENVERKIKYAGIPAYWSEHPVETVYFLRKYNTIELFLEDHTKTELDQERENYRKINLNLDKFLEDDDTYILEQLPLNGDTILWAAEHILEKRVQELADREAFHKQEEIRKALEAKYLGDYPPKGLSHD